MSKLTPEQEAAYGSMNARKQPALSPEDMARIRAEERERAAARDDLKRERRAEWGINRLTPWLLLLVLLLLGAMWAIFGPPAYWFGRSPYGF